MSLQIGIKPAKQREREKEREREREKIDSAKGT
jgi:hypothetical protein